MTKAKRWGVVSTRSNLHISESNMQAAVVEWARMQSQFDFRLKNLFAVPNGAVVGGHNKFALINKLKREGMEPGVPDLVLLWPSGCYHFFCIEMKSIGKKQSPAQIKWQEQIMKAGGLYYLCYSPTEAINELKEYLSLDKINKQAGNG